MLAIDYRLMPEHGRMAGVDDCRTAYRWILENGPDGPGALDVLFVSGDSAGGNLTLAVIAWARDAGLHAANAAIALSPTTDGTFGSPRNLGLAALVLAVVVVITAVIVPGLRSLEFATGQDSYLNADSQIAKDNELFQSQFGGEVITEILG